MLCYKDPTNYKTRKELVEDGKLIQNKSNRIWDRIKKSLLGLIGVAMIVTGILGMIPSFGASIGLIVVGGLLCTYAGVTQFKHFIPPKIKPFMIMNKDIRSMLNQGKILMVYKIVTKELTTVNAKDDFEVLPKFSPNQVDKIAGDLNFSYTSKKR